MTAELPFFRQIMQQLHIQTLLLKPGDMNRFFPDLGLRATLGRFDSYALTIRAMAQYNRPHTIYRFTDEFQCSYIFFLLPEGQENEALLIGPYLRFQSSREMLHQMAVERQMTQEQYHRFENCFSAIPVLSDEAPITAMLTALGNRLWKGPEGFEFLDINTALGPANDSVVEPSPEAAEQALKMHMVALEQRYAHENELMELVSKGRSQKALSLVQNFSLLIMEDRTPVPLRNQKNYCIILNTLLRKATEKGGVHPLHIDRLSSDLAHRIERLRSMDELTALMQHMIREYCRLVKRHTTDYSPPIQRTMLYVDYDLSADLSLRACAKLLSISPGYLSALFKKEVGQTLTEYVTRRRMEYAAYLLDSSQHSLSTIAHLCGIPDDNYFGKLFKKHTGKTPRQFREERRLLRGEPSKS